MMKTLTVQTPNETVIVKLNNYAESDTLTQIMALKARAIAAPAAHVTVRDEANDVAYRITTNRSVRRVR
ncbi:MAG: hypothetical protein KDC32_20255 [Saprospiraceae bacterium]|nr:hypothetical protein [Saprospiraceae bacterium]